MKIFFVGIGKEVLVGNGWERCLCCLFYCVGDVLVGCVIFFGMVVGNWLV